MEIVHAIESIITTEDVNASVVHDGRVPVTSTWWRCVECGLDLGPLLGIKVEFEKIVSSVGAVVASKDIKVVSYCY